MAMTKAEAAKLTQDLLLRGVIETVVKESQLLQLLPFMEVTGTAVTYNREATMPAAQFYDVGDAWQEATPTFAPVTTALKILGGDADVDNFLQATYADPNDIEAEVIGSRAKAVAHLFSDAFFNGDAAANPKAFDGISRAIPAAQTLAAGANGGPLTLDLMDQLIDLVKPGRPDALLVSKRTRRKLSGLWTQSPHAAVDGPGRGSRPGRRLAEQAPWGGGPGRALGPRHVGGGAGAARIVGGGSHDGPLRAGRTAGGRMHRAGRPGLRGPGGGGGGAARRRRRPVAVGQAPRQPVARQWRRTQSGGRTRLTWTSPQEVVSAIAWCSDGPIEMTRTCRHTYSGTVPSNWMNVTVVVASAKWHRSRCGGPIRTAFDRHRGWCEP
jgi:hypothetical protein